MTQLPIDPLIIMRYRGGPKQRYHTGMHDSRVLLYNINNNNQS